MCTMIAHQVKIQGRGKNGPEWFEVREANVSYDHPYDLPLEHALNIDFVNEALGPGARVAVELSVEAARQLVKTIEAVLAAGRPARRSRGHACRRLRQPLAIAPWRNGFRHWMSARAVGDPARRALPVPLDHSSDGGHRLEAARDACQPSR